MSFATSAPVHSQAVYQSQPDSRVRLLLHDLHEYLPYSLPFYRRLQFHLSHPNPPYAQTFHSPAAAHRTGQPLSREDDWLHHELRQDLNARPAPWLAAHIDLSRAGETQIWVFANWECPRDTTPNQDPGAGEIEARRVVLQQLFETIYNAHCPQMPATPPEAWNLVKRRNMNNLPFSRTRVLFGACHALVRLLIPQAAITRVDAPYLKYLFPQNCYNSPPRAEQDCQTDAREIELPAGYRYGELQEDHLTIVLDRSHIPRSIKTLASLLGIGLFHTSQASPVSWGFLGVDGSLTSLHTEPEHRGKSLAVLLARELFRQQGEFFRTKAGGRQPARGALEVPWAHADVSRSNMRSRRVMEKVGGSVSWEDWWVEVELEQVVGKDGCWRPLE